MTVILFSRINPVKTETGPASADREVNFMMKKVSLFCNNAGDYLLILVFFRMNNPV